MFTFEKLLQGFKRPQMFILLPVVNISIDLSFFLYVKDPLLSFKRYQYQ